MANLPDRSQFDEVYMTLESGQPLDLEMIGKVFGPDFYLLLIYLLMDAQDAARAISGALMKLRAGN